MYTDGNRLWQVKILRHVHSDANTELVEETGRLATGSPQPWGIPKREGMPRLRPTNSEALASWRQKLPRAGLKSGPS